MLSIFGPRPHNRRELLRAGALSALGLTTADVARLRAAAPGAAKNRKHSCVFLFLFGGPSHIDLWDMKPNAVPEIRGEYTPTATSVPGIQVCEHLPNLGLAMKDVCLVRSMTHRMNVHGPACSEVLSGRPYHQAPTTDQMTREDWPSIASLVTRHGESRNALPASVVLPWYLQFPGQAKRIAGQTGGRMGERFNPFLVNADLAAANARIDGLELTGDLTTDRLRGRGVLLDQLQSHGPRVDDLALRSNVASAQRMLENQAGRAFDLSREPQAVRKRYGMTTIGQSLLLARRLVEAGVGLVTVNWQDETKTDGTDTCWDTHKDNFTKLKTLLCPLFDQAYPTFLADLRERGLLDSTLVVAVGEFGRTPKMGQFTQSSNTKKSGRDHWPHAFTALLAGGGVRGGQVYGRTTPDAGYVADRPVTPGDLSATVLHHLGINPAATYIDEFQQRTNLLSEGEPIKDLE